MIILSKRDTAVQEWIDQQLSDADYEYYDDISKVDLFKAIYKDIQQAAGLAEKNFKKAIPLYDDIEIKLAKNIGENAIARYMSYSSVNVPIILIGVDAIFKALKSEAEEYSMDISPEGINNYIIEQIYPGVMISIYHELGHAMVDEYRAFDWDIDLNEEDFVEDFAREFYDTGEITDDMKQLISDLIKLRNGEELE